MKLKVEDILKPGAVLRTEKIDFEKEPELKALFENTKREQERVRRQAKITDWSFLNDVINI